jgi:thiol-disulfide isomerase/thioredoxin
MALTESTMLPLGTTAPAFSLPDFDGRLHTFDASSEGDAFLVMFICNHCPFVKHIKPALARLAHAYAGRVTMYAINSNDATTHPADSPAHMREDAEAFDYVFPYLVDESQDVARAYRAACTPEFYLFDAGRRLVYRGQFDDSRPGNGIDASGADLRRAIDAVLAGRQPDADQKPSVGCNIKWRAG